MTKQGTFHEKVQKKMSFMLCMKSMFVLFVSKLNATYTWKTSAGQSKYYMSGLFYFPFLETCLKCRNPLLKSFNAQLVWLYYVAVIIKYRFSWYTWVLQHM